MFCPAPARPRHTPVSRVALLTALALGLHSTLPAWAQADTGVRYSIDSSGRAIQQAPGQTAAYVQGELLVTLKNASALGSQNGLPRSSFSGLQNLLDRFAARSLQPLLPAGPWSSRLAQRLQTLGAAQQAQASALREQLQRTVVLKLAPNDMEAVAAQFRADPQVAAVQPNYILRLSMLPNDPYYASRNTWGQSYDDLWGHKAINAAAAWDKGQGKNVVVAVIDTGVDFSHPDLAANAWVNSADSAGNGQDDDGNGYADDRNGWDFYNQRANPADENGHGTHVAGTIAAVGNNQQGIIGVAPQARIMGLRAFDRYGNSTVSALVEAIRYAADNGADIINASWSGPGDLEALRTAVQYAHTAGVTLVVSASNDGRELEYNNPGLYGHTITVGASTAAGRRASFSDFGAKLDVIAPGEDILSTLASNSQMGSTPGVAVGGNLLRLSGTSMAAPHVSGVAALILGKFPGYTPEQVRYVLRNSSNDFGAAGWDPFSGYGQVDANKAISFTATPPRVFAELRTPHAQKAAPYNRFVNGRVSISGSANGPDFARYTVSYARYDSDTGSPSFQTLSSSTTPVSDGELASWDTSSLAAGRYLLKLSVSNSAGKGLDTHTVVFRDSIKPGFPRVVNSYKGFPGGWRYINNPATPALADLDGDGKKEIITVDNNGLYIFRHDGSPFPGWPRFLPYAVGGPVTVADLDGDGKPEVIAYSRSPVGEQPIHAFKADGSLLAGFPAGRLSGGEVPTAGWANIDYSTVVAADIDGDRQTDLVYLTGFFNNGVGKLMLSAIDARGNAKPGFPKTVSNELTHAFRPLVVGDLDKDGAAEIIVSVLQPATQSQALLIYKGDGRLHRQRGFSNIADTGSPRQYDMLVDVDKDGTPEIFTTTTPLQGEVTAWLLSSTLETLPGWPKPLKSAQAYGFGDLDGNGDLELFSSISASTDSWVTSGLAALQHTGADVGGFPKQTGMLNLGRFGDYSGMVGSPVDKSNKAAFFAMTEVANMGADSMNRDGLWGFNATGDALPGWPKSIPPTFAWPSVADLDGDGTLEIVVHSEDGMLYVWSEPAASASTAWTTFMGNVRHDGVWASPADWTCREFSAKNSDHATASRAYTQSSGSFFPTTTWYAKGSAQSLGTSASTVNTLAETREGYFIKGKCPVAPKLDSLSVTLSGNNVTVSGKASDADGDLARVELQFDGSGTWMATQGTSTWSLTRNDLSAGSHSVKARAVDQGGRLSAESTTQTFTVPSTTPASACVTAKNTLHISEGRAYACGTTYSPKACAKGSGQDLGSSSSYLPATTSVQQTAPNYWVKVAACS